MSIHDTRKENLLALIKRFGTQKAFADKADFPPTYVSQLVTDVRNVGGTTARKIETNLNLPKDWMESPHLDNLDVLTVAENIGTYKTKHDENQPVTVGDIIKIKTILDYAEQAMDETGIEMDEQELCAFAKEMLEMWNNRENPILYPNVLDLLKYREKLKYEYR